MEKTMYRLSPEEAESLGLKIKKDAKQSKALYYLNKDRRQQYAGFSAQTTTSANDYEYNKSVLSAWDSETGRVMDLPEFCERYGLRYDLVSSAKFLPLHYGVPTWNIAFHEQKVANVIDEKEVRRIIEKELSKSIKPLALKKTGKRKGVVKIADLHLGAKIKGLLKTKDFDLTILRGYLQEAAIIINRMGFDIVHIHLLGDIIESFTGLNHKNSWKGLNSELIGAEAVIMAVKVLQDDFLGRIENLGELKIVSGNHDRVTSDNKEDTGGDVARLVAWGLELRGFSVEHNHKVITHTVDGIHHILSHGHLGLTKKTDQLLWDYGKKGFFNLMTFGHLHSVIKRLSIKQREKFEVVNKDSVDSRVMWCLSLFTGNEFSEDLAFTSTAGFHIIEDNGRGVPHVYDLAL
ncbi:hypothetical protein Phi46:1_gp22 [Cellulophaga phage phi46:1]|uniref:hypothetical protein n=1 Tax=Cellulophaga phage phi46:1 TaxID=1327974 RepID=UPI0003517B8D|nr:hypothetical protein Phi46:1_gp22 [Cellulophaga phage phi46:1]AGO47833.1 hypothetical protein Phi46:1_gp22 [Cellulophaga phage phi46:1]